MKGMKGCNSEERIQVTPQVNYTFVMCWQTRCKARFATPCYPIGKDFYPEFAGRFRFRRYL